MERIKLRFENIQQVVGSSELSVLLLTDEGRKRALSVVCDEPITRQILMRLQNPDRCKNMLAEALMQMLTGTYQMMIYGIHNGQYQVVLADEDFVQSTRIRMSDAALLSIISETPLYIESQLFQRQSVPYDEHARGISIPINAMDAPRLQMALKQAIEEENYELASQLRDELKRRTTQDS